MTFNFMAPDFDELIKEMFEDDLKQKEADAKNKNKDGMACKKCHVFNEYVTEPNQDDKTYICYKCRKF